MTNLKILAQPRISIYSELFPFYRWRSHLKDEGINFEVIQDAQNKRLLGGDHLLIQSKYYSNGWRNIKNRTVENENNLIDFLTMVRKDSGNVIWFDQSDSTGFLDFPVINFVDSFVVKQMLKDINYYAEPHGNKNSRIWLNQEFDSENQDFIPCPKDQLHKIKLGWNIGYNDYRQFRQSFKFMSNYIGYNIYPLSVTSPTKSRLFDTAFRGNVNYGDVQAIASQRNNILKVVKELESSFNIAQGKKISKSAYRKELKDSKVCISPFGYGEICYRDFEAFLSGALIIKPSMDHLITFPNVYIANQTYIPISWDLNDLQSKFENVISNYDSYIDIAKQGQNNYLNIVNNPECFVQAVKRVLSK